MTWKGPVPSPPDLSPYVHWWYDTEDPQVQKALNLVDLTPSAFRDAARDMADESYGGGSAVPIPKKSRNPKEPDNWNPHELMSRLPKVDPNTIIIGIVDTGIGLGHRSFRMQDGSTRFVAAWQQTAPFDPEQPQLPCGQELYSREINAAIQRHGAENYLDEEAFNRELCLVDPSHPFGQRDLDHAGAHGTHVLDLAAGHDPVYGDSAKAKQQRIIAINLPAPYMHGSAGNFLAFFAVLAVKRILFLADALWHRNNPDGKPVNGVIGYPIVLNFSYGMQAGPKDGTHEFERAFKKIIKERIKTFKDGNKHKGTASAVRLVMPAGNDNLSRGAASIVLGKEGSTLKLRENDDGSPVEYDATPEVIMPWRIKPGDATSNFAEIWTDAKSLESRPDSLLEDFKLFVTPPGAQRLEVKGLKSGKHYDLGNCARVYCSEHKAKSNGIEHLRLRLVICVAPTLAFAEHTPYAPAGLWEIKVQYDAEPATDVSFYVQSDQSIVRASNTGLLSYFDHPNYATHLETGRVRDSYAYDLKVPSKDLENWRIYGPVQRRGTHNALASVSLDDALASVICIGGYRDSDGAPALYSAAADGGSTKAGGREAISVSFPSENGAAHFGLLGAGARDGSVTAFRGTSMAAALATRFIAEELGPWLDGPREQATLGTERWIRDRGREWEDEIRKSGFTNEWGEYTRWSGYKILKSGVGRLPSPDAWHRGRVHRFGGE